MAELQAKEHEKAAEKKLTSFALFNKSQKYEDAAELFAKAGNQYKLSADWQKAGEMYQKAAETVEKYLKDEHTEVASHYSQAAQCYQKCSPTDALRIFRIVVQMNIGGGRLAMAAKQWKEIAQLEEKEGRVKEAIDAWEQSSKCYMAENSKTSSHDAKLNIARLYSQEEEFKKAIEIWDQVAKESVDSDLGRWRASEFLYKALLCEMLLDARRGTSTNVEERLDHSIDMFPAFENSRECKFVKSMVDAMKNQDSDKFTDAVFKYDQITKLVQCCSLLLAFNLCFVTGPMDNQDFA